MELETYGVSSYDLASHMTANESLNSITTGIAWENLILWALSQHFFGDYDEVTSENFANRKDADYAFQKDSFTSLEVVSLLPLNTILQF